MLKITKFKRTMVNRYQYKDIRHYQIQGEIRDLLKARFATIFGLKQYI